MFIVYVSGISVKSELWGLISGSERGASMREITMTENPGSFEPLHVHGDPDDVWTRAEVTLAELAEREPGGETEEPRVRPFTPTPHDPIPHDLPVPPDPPGDAAHPEDPPVSPNETAALAVEARPQSPRPNPVGLNLYSPISRGPTTRLLLSPPDLQWSPASAFGIQKSTDPEVWNAGHVNAILADGLMALVGAETGGVWLIWPEYGAIPQYKSFPAQPLSWDWPNPHINALAAGPDGPTTVYAGGGWIDGSTSSLHVIGLTAALGGLSFDGALEVSVPWGLSINQIVVQGPARRVVLATGSGVLWSAIPADPMDVGGYSWRYGDHVPTNISGIALGPGDSVVAAVYGDEVAGSVNSGFYVGTWSGSTLNFTRSTITGGGPAMGRTSVASSANHPSVLYAVAAAADNMNMGSLFRSGDGGATFAQLPLPSNPGLQGFWNNCVDVHPEDPAIVAVGWRTGPFVSTNSGQTWRNTTDNNNVHSDVHTVTFADTGNGVNLWVGTDGGVALSADFGASWDSRYNKHLRNLQYYGSVDVGAMSPFDASDWAPGLYGAGTQDNGNLWARHGDEGTRSSVRQFEGGDGSTVMFVTETIVLHRNNTLTRADGTEFGNRIRRSNYDPGTHEMDSDLGTVVPAEGYPDGLPFPDATSVVTGPSYSRDNARMLAVAAKGTQVYGYFDTASPGSFKRIANIGRRYFLHPPTITSVASYNGHSILVGTSQGDILMVDSATGTVTDQATNFAGWAGRKIGRLIWPTATERYGTVSDNVVVRWDPIRSVVLGSHGSWILTSGTLTSGATGIAHSSLETGGSALFACTDFGVEVSMDRGSSWTGVSARLPARPHCRDIRVGRISNGHPALFVATYGWGAFVSELPRPSDGGFGHIPLEVAIILFGIIADGDGVEIVNGHIVRVPPREPARDLALALAYLGLGQHLKGPGAELTTRLGEEMLVIAGFEDVLDIRGVEGGTEAET